MRPWPQSPSINILAHSYSKHTLNEHTYIAHPRPKTAITTTDPTSGAVSRQQGRARHVPVQGCGGQAQRNDEKMRPRRCQSPCRTSGGLVPRRPYGSLNSDSQLKHDSREEVKMREAAKRRAGALCPRPPPPTRVLTSGVHGGGSRRRDLHPRQPPSGEREWVSTKDRTGTAVVLIHSVAGWMSPLVADSLHQEAHLLPPCRTAAAMENVIMVRHTSGYLPGNLTGTDVCRTGGPPRST